MSVNIDMENFSKKRNLRRRTLNTLKSAVSALKQMAKSDLDDVGKVSVLVPEMEDGNASDEGFPAASDVELPVILDVESLTALDVGSPDTPVVELSAAPNVKILAAPYVASAVTSEVESPAAPPYSPLTPLVNARKAIAETKKESPVALTALDVGSPDTPVVELPAAPNVKILAAPYVASVSTSEVESPAAPPYSPLTPLVNARQAVVEARTDENFSPLPSMSPSTLELYETLSRDFSTIQDVQMTQVCCTNNLSKNESDQDEDFDADTDSDYVPDSGEESDATCSSVKQKAKTSVYIPASDSSEGTTVEIQTHVALVHDNQTRPDRIYQKRHNKRPPINTNTISEDEALDEINSVSEGTHTEDVHPDASTVRSLNEHNDLPMIDHSEADNINLTENNDLPRTMGRSKCGRKRKHPEYCISEKKNRKYMNLSYHVKDKLIQPKTFLDYSCTCKQECFKLLSKEKREQEFNLFVTLGSYEAQVLHILSNVNETEKARSYTSTKKTKTGKKKPRQYRRNYHICETEVCKDMFLKTFQISSKKVDMALEKKRLKHTYKDKRGNRQGGSNKTSEEDIDFVKNIINALPKYESHYRREKNSGTHYLKLGMTVQKIYEMYIEEFEKVFGSEKKHVSYATLKRIFYTCFNLRCKTLKKDTCKNCDSLALHISNCHDPEQKEQFINLRNAHQIRAEDLRNQMSQDLARAKIDPKFECVTYDLEKTLPLPRIPTNVVFYKRQLWVYNAGIHVGSTDQGRCNVWVEGEAGRGAQEVGSCLINFIKSSLRDEVEDLALWSDCCGGQNRNIKIVLMLKCILNSHPTLKTITLKYLETGHSFLPNDTDFSKIECQLKYHERIYTAEEYIKVMEIAKKKNPLHVTRMKTQDFLSTKKIERKIVNRKICTNKNKVSWLKTKQILLTKEDKYMITMTSESGDIQTVDLSKRYRGVLTQFSEEDFEVLWPHGKAIPQPKLDDLRSMYGLIPEDCHAFYNNLMGNGIMDINEDIDGYGPTLDFVLEEEEDV